jgi:hypothetical protein
MPDHACWEARLRAAYNASTQDQRAIKLASGMPISGEPNSARIEMTRLGIEKNMQDDAAAFDAWAFALRAWLGVERVTLAWPADALSDNGHARRFQFRAEGAAGLCGDWFALERELPRLFDPASRYFLNVESTPRGGNPKPFSLALSEHDLEVTLAHDPVASRRLKDTLALEHLGRQLPVGVFRDRVAKDPQAQVFPGSHSAIDLWGLAGERLTLIELKKTGNAKVGALSEVLFYAAVMRMVQRGQWSFQPDATSEGPFRKIPKTTSLDAVILAPEFHPLLEGNGAAVVRAVNSAFERAGEPVRLHLVRIERELSFTSLT